MVSTSLNKYISAYVTISQVEFPPIISITACEGFRYKRTGIRYVLASCMRMAKRVESITVNKFLNIPWTFPTMTLMWLDHVSRPLKITPRLEADSTKSILFPLIIIFGTFESSNIVEKLDREVPRFKNCNPLAYIYKNPRNAICWYDSPT